MNLKKQILERLPKGRRGENICEFDNGYDFGWNACLSDVRKAIESMKIEVDIDIIKILLESKGVFDNWFERGRRRKINSLSQAIAKNIDEIVRVKWEKY